MAALRAPELEESETPLTKAMANNVKLQVSRLLDEEVRLKMADEYVRLQLEEKERVNNYTVRW